MRRSRSGDSWRGLRDDELAEHVADVEQLRLEDDRSTRVAVDRNAPERDRLGVVAGEAVRERVRTLRERLHRGAREAVLAGEDGQRTVRTVLGDVLDVVRVSGERARLIVLQAGVAGEVLR